MPVCIDCLPRVKRCCCCHNLRTGSLIIGWCTLISSILYVIHYSLHFANPDIYPGAVKFNYMFLAIKRKVYDDDEDPRMLSTGIMDLACWAIFGIFTIMLLVGIYKEKAVLVMYWIYCAYIQLFRVTILEANKTALKIIFEEHIGDIVGSAILIVVNLCLTFYFIIVIASFYKEIVIKKQEEANETKI